jgi:hypothetical protein
MDVSGKVNFRPEEELILCCARTDLRSDIEFKILSLLKKDLDWHYILDEAFYHKMTPLLYLNLNKYPDMVPVNVLSDLENKFLEVSRRNFILAGKLFEILDLLNSNGILAIPYKGLVLALLAYGDLALRDFGDLDVFVRKEDIVKAKELLNSNGFDSCYELDHSQMELLFRFQHEYKFFQNNPTLILELHWDFNVNRLHNDMIYDSNYITQVRGDGFCFSTFAPEELVLILSLHASGHLWDSLGWICDIAQIINTYKELNWDRILDKASKSSVNRILGVSLLLAKELIGVNLPDDVYQKFAEDKKVQSISYRMQKNLFNKDSINFYWSAWDRIGLRESFINEIRDYLSIFFNPRPAQLATIPIPNSLYPLYYVNSIYLALKYIKRTGILKILIKLNKTYLLK